MKNWRRPFSFIQHRPPVSVRPGDEAARSPPSFGNSPTARAATNTEPIVIDDDELDQEDAGFVKLPSTHSTLSSSSSNVSSSASCPKEKLPAEPQSDNTQPASKRIKILDSPSARKNLERSPEEITDGAVDTVRAATQRALETANKSILVSDPAREETEDVIHQFLKSWPAAPKSPEPRKIEKLLNTVSPPLDHTKAAGEAPLTSAAEQLVVEISAPESEDRMGSVSYPSDADDKDDEDDEEGGEEDDKMDVCKTSKSSKSSSSSSSDDSDAEDKDDRQMGFGIAGHSFYFRNQSKGDDEDYGQAEDDNEEDEEEPSDDDDSSYHEYQRASGRCKNSSSSCSKSAANTVDAANAASSDAETAPSDDAEDAEALMNAARLLDSADEAAGAATFEDQSAAASRRKKRKYCCLTNWAVGATAVVAVAAYVYTKFDLADFSGL